MVQRSTLTLVKLVAWENLVFLFFSTFRMLSHYVNLYQKTRPVRWFNTVYAWLLMLHVTLYFAYIGIIGCWFVLAAVLEPGKFLPFGVGVVVVIVVGTGIASELTAAARKLKEKLAAAFEFILQERMKRAMETFELELWEKMRKESQGLASNAEEEELEERIIEPPEPIEGKVTPLDLFMALNTNGTNEMGKAEFMRVFELLDLNITEDQKDQLFAFCDISMDGKISEQEFSEGWELMVEVFLENSADSLGLSMAQIVFVVASLLTMLILLISFVLITLSAWQNEGNFQAVVQSSLVAGCGKATAALRARSKAEDADSLDDIVGNIISSQEESSGDSGGGE